VSEDLARSGRATVSTGIVAARAAGRGFLGTSKKLRKTVIANTDYALAAEYPRAALLRRLWSRAGASTTRAGQRHLAGPEARFNRVGPVDLSCRWVGGRPRDKFTGQAWRSSGRRFRGAGSTPVSSTIAKNSNRSPVRSQTRPIWEGILSPLSARRAATAIPLVM